MKQKPTTNPTVTIVGAIIVTAVIANVNQWAVTVVVIVVIVLVIKLVIDCLGSK